MPAAASAPEPAEAVEVPRAGRVVDDADAHEQGGLEQRVGQDVEARGPERQRRPQADERDEQPELADGRVRHQRLEVAPGHRDPGTEHRRRATDQHERPVPQRQPLERRGEAEQQVDAGLHHRRRVEVGRDGSRGDHGAREPELERHLRRLGARGQGDEDDHRRRGAGGADLGPGGEDPRQGGGPRGLGQQHRRGQQRQAAERRHEQRAPGAGGALRPVAADQEEARDARQLPGDEQEDDVVGEDDAEHRRREQRQQRDGPDRGRVVGLEVPPGVQHHEDADDGHDEGEQQPQRVEAQGQRDAGVRQPGARPRGDATVEDRRDLATERRRDPGQDRRGGQRDPAPEPAPEQRQQRRRDERRGHRERQQHGGSLPDARG
jgi:hypothetical protein